MSETAGSRFAFRRCGATSGFPLGAGVSPETISIGDSVIIDDFVFLMGGEERESGVSCTSHPSPALLVEDASFSRTSPASRAAAESTRGTTTTLARA